MKSEKSCKATYHIDANECKYVTKVPKHASYSLISGMRIISYRMILPLLIRLSHPSERFESGWLDVVPMYLWFAYEVFIYVLYSRQQNSCEIRHVLGIPILLDCAQSMQIGKLFLKTYNLVKSSKVINCCIATIDYSKVHRVAIVIVAAEGRCAK